MRIILGVAAVALLASCLDDEPPRPRPQPTDSDGKGDDGEDGELIPDEQPAPDEPSCGEAQKPGDGACLP